MPLTTKERTPRNGRITVMATQEVLNGVTALAQMNNTSVNDLICTLLGRVVKKNSAAIAQFEKSKAESRELIQSLFPDDTATKTYPQNDDIEVSF